MLKKIVAGALMIGMLALPGCGKSNFQTHSDNLAKRSLYHDTAKKEAMKYGFEALQKIMGFYEEQAKNVAKETKGKTLFKYTAYDNKQNIVGTYEMADVTAGYVSIINNMTISTSRERVVREFAPIFEAIAKDLIEAGTPPKSWVDVASEFVKHVPLVASMGAMYGLTTMAIDKAGNTISANLKDNAQLNIVNGKGNSQAVDGSTVNNPVATTTNNNSGTNNGNTQNETTVPEEVELEPEAATEATQEVIE